MDNFGTSLRLGLPKGRMQEALFALMADAGIKVRVSPRAYRPTLSMDAEVKLLKPQNILRMLAAGSRDAGFAGADWVEELGLDLVEVLDTGLNPVRLVVAAPESLLERGELPRRPLVLATEYEALARRWIDQNDVDARIIRSYGATEVFPPEDADLILDNSATGATLVANGLKVVATVMTSTTRLYASREALLVEGRRKSIEQIALSLRAVLAARERVMIEVNVPESALNKVVEAMPSMRRPTISRLAGDDGYAIKAAVLREHIPTLVTSLRTLGASDIVITRPEQILP